MSYLERPLRKQPESDKCYGEYFVRYEGDILVAWKKKHLRRLLLEREKRARQMEKSGVSGKIFFWASLEGKKTRENVSSGVVDCLREGISLKEKNHLKVRENGRVRVGKKLKGERGSVFFRYRESRLVFLGPKLVWRRVRYIFFFLVVIKGMFLE